VVPRYMDRGERRVWQNERGGLGKKKKIVAVTIIDRREGIVGEEIVKEKSRESVWVTKQRDKEGLSPPLCDRNGNIC